VKKADLLVGAVLVAGDRAPHVVSKDLVKKMSPGSVIVDVSIDQGGCIETSRPTSHEVPTYVEHNVIHYVFRTSGTGADHFYRSAHTHVPYVLNLQMTVWTSTLRRSGPGSRPAGKRRKITHPVIAKLFPKLS